MGFLKKMVNAKEWGLCPVCGGKAGWGARDRHWTCLDSRGDHHGPVSDDGRPLTMSESMDEALMPEPEIRQVSHDLRGHLLAEASDRFGEALQQGLTVPMEVGQAAAIIGAWASDGATEGEAFETACEVVMAGYAWRLCEQAGRRGSPFPAIYGLPPAHQRYLDLLAAQPSETPTVLLVSAASDTVGTGDPIHHHSPGAISYGREFLAAGANIARASLVDCAWMNDAQFETLFLTASASAMPTPLSHPKPPTPQASRCASLWLRNHPRQHSPRSRPRRTRRTRPHRGSAPTAARPPAQGRTAASAGRRSPASEVLRRRRSEHPTRATRPLAAGHHRRGRRRAHRSIAPRLPTCPSNG